MKVASRMKRNYGIDLLRMLLMFMVVMLHMLGNGGILNTVTLHSANYYSAWTLEVLCYCAVNCYAMISGYVTFERKYKITSLVMIWIQTILYTLITTILFVFLFDKSVSLSYFLKTFLSLENNPLWYVPAYTGLYVFIPILNTAVSSMTVRQTKGFFLLSMFLLTIVPTATTMDPLGLQQGYSTLWLMYLYLIGAMMKKYNIKDYTKKYNFILIYFICILMMLIYKVGTSFLTMHLFGQVKFDGLLINYTSPTMVFAAMGLLLYFVSLDLDKRTCKWIGILSPAAFGVYLLHNQPLLHYAMTNRLSPIANLPTIWMLVWTLGLSAMLYILCMLIDLLRIYLSKLINLKKKVASLEEKLLCLK